MANALIKISRQTVVLPSDAQWENRFEIRSETSDRIYVIAQNKQGRWWGCSCPGWKRHRTCKHLNAVGLPAAQKPFEASLAMGA